MIDRAVERIAQAQFDYENPVDENGYALVPRAKEKEQDKTTKKSKGKGKKTKKHEEKKSSAKPSSEIFNSDPALQDSGNFSQAIIEEEENLTRSPEEGEVYTQNDQEDENKETEKDVNVTDEETAEENTDDRTIENFAVQMSQEIEEAPTYKISASDDMFASVNDSTNHSISAVSGDKEEEEGEERGHVK